MVAQPLLLSGHSHKTNLMKKNALLIAGIFAMVVCIPFLLHTCQPSQRTGQQGATAATIDSLLKANNLNYDTNGIQVIEAIDQKQLDLALSNAEGAEKQLLGMVVRLQKELSSQGLKLTQLSEVVSSTRYEVSGAWKTVIDSLAVKSPVPNPQRMFDKSDEWLNLLVYDNGSDVGVSVVSLNVFDLIHYVDSVGVSWARVENKNPHTTTLPGTNVFKLGEAPVQQTAKAIERRNAVVLGGGYLGKPFPFVAYVRTF
jgi:hypothetical protein